MAQLCHEQRGERLRSEIGGRRSAVGRRPAAVIIDMPGGAPPGVGKNRPVPLSPSAIITRRFRLDPLQATDADAMVTVLGDPRMYAFTGGSPPTLDALRDRYRHLAVGHSADGRELWFNWIVRRISDRQAVGVLQASVAADGKSADVAWEIGTPWQGLGIASEAAVAIVAWLIEHGVTHIRACIHESHSASARVAERAGLRPTDEWDDGEVVWRNVPDNPTE